ncbi:(2Fe-2S) ferredoxin domain-containing protein [Actinorugispora endophytica]|uniref:(2Fe-2S) ferredoxin n=1 Tax=Actinorugispora endophytica TaxID=1605990 RepID=A0A4R6UTX7_9ACTN|nr:(2Fe-2S) ferredoxin domain-containing protein [Actinorugispora endophytica]TDQ46914.1 hypothetical protein EV190_12370 [Actinorugispora endophytica]
MTSVGQPCRLVVCRGCCCGTKKKRPGVDHKGQLARLSALRDHEGRAVPVRVSKCLGICFKANVVVVQPSSRGRAEGGRPVWLGDFTEDRLVRELDDWVFAGGPGAAPLPEALEQHVTSKDAKKPKKSKKSKKDKKDKKKGEAGRKKRDAKPGKKPGKG